MPKPLGSLLAGSHNKYYDISGSILGPAIHNNYHIHCAGIIVQVQLVLNRNENKDDIVLHMYLGFRSVCGVPFWNSY